MSAQSVYLKVILMSVRSASNLSKRRIDELNSGIGELRRLLSCVVCSQLLMDPYTPKGKRCQHNVCRLCLRGRKLLFPSCPQCDECSDFKTYEENRSMALLLLCYKTLCAHLLQSSLFAQLLGLRPEMGQGDPLPLQLPRIKLPPMSTQDFIREGSNYDDMGDTFLPQPDLPFLKGMPSSLPAETPPTTAATTPELPFEQQLPDEHQLSISDIEMEAASTGETHFTPLEMMPTAQIILSSATQHVWTEEVDLSQAVSMTSFPSSNSNFAVSYVMPTASSSPFEEFQIGQVVQMEQIVETEEVPVLEPMELEEVPVLESVEEEASVIEQMEVEKAPLLEPVEVEKAPVLELVELEEAPVLEQVEMDEEEVLEQVELEEVPVLEPEELETGSTEDSVELEEALEPVTEPSRKRKLDQMEEEDEEEDKGLEELIAAAAEEAKEELKAAASEQTKEELTAEEAREEEIVATRETEKGEVREEEEDASTADESKEESLSGKTEELNQEQKNTEETVELEEETIRQAPVTRKRARSPNYSEKPSPKITKMDTAPATVVQPPKSAFRRVRGRGGKQEKKSKLSCRCGVSGPSNPLTTCRNGRCPCYKSGNGCSDCNCVGCKNPHKGEFIESDEDSDEVVRVQEKKQSKREEKVADEAPKATPEKEKPDAAPGAAAGLTLVPLSNLQQSQHPLILVQNEKGEFQGFNIIQGSEPVDLALHGFVRVQLQNNDGNDSIPQYAWVMPPPMVEDPAPNPPPPSKSPSPPPPPPPPPPEQKRAPIESPSKKFRTSSRLRRGRSNFAALETVDELVSGGSSSNPAAGDRLSATDNAHSLFEEIMSGSDDLIILREDFPDFF
ncbi:hypothetical protein KR009_003558 [Drosophila setifemur]|nr:hypothetical protein KR009_003558 [Drosophila setifemur]